MIIINLNGFKEWKLDYHRVSKMLQYKKEIHLQYLNKFSELIRIQNKPKKHIMWMQKLGLLDFHNITPYLIHHLFSKELH
jgi:hypothetical protein